MAAIQDKITTKDETKIRDALSSPDRAHWPVDIDKELDTLVENDT